MKLLHVINSLSTGGAEKLLVDILPLLVGRGITIDLLLLDGTCSPFLRQLKETNCCNVYILGKSSVYNPLLIFRIIPYLKKYDIIHVHLFPAMYWVAIAKIISFSKSKLIFTEHNTVNSRIGNIVFRQIDKIIYKAYRKIISITSDVKHVLITKLNLKDDKCIVVNNGINLSKISNAVALSKKDYSILPDAKILIQISRFNKQKDQVTLIESMKYLPENIILLLVGDGYLKQECELLVSNLRIENRVLFLGIRMDVPELLKMSDVVVQSSHWEGFGLAAVEGMAAKKPVIASNVPGLGEIVNGAGLLFEKGDNKQLGGLITDLLNNKKYYDEVCERCYQRAQKYSIDLMVSKTMDIYYSL